MDFKNSDLVETDSEKESEYSGLSLEDLIPGSREYYEKRSELRRQQWEIRKREKIRRRNAILLMCVLIPLCVCLAGGATFGFCRLGMLLGTLAEKNKVLADEVANNGGDVPLITDAEAGDDAVMSAEESDSYVTDISENEDFASEEPTKNNTSYLFAANDAAVYMGSDEFTSQYGVLVNVDTMTVTAVKAAYERMNPASMTKILTLLVAVEHIDDLQALFEVPIEATDYSYVNDGSAAGFAAGEIVTVEDLLYGTILPSGADAAYCLALLTAGSHEAFVDMMNAKLEALGIGDTTHFTNCVGIYNADHYSRTIDMAVILAAAMDNEICRTVLNARTYTTSLTEQHPEGLLLSNWFMRRIEDKDCGGEVMGAKTGYVAQSGCCAASYFTAEDGTSYICVSGNTHSSWRAIYDHVAVYNIYAVGNTAYHK